jgi:glycosyltransferase involved in cell wall biosynthesis
VLLAFTNIGEEGNISKVSKYINSLELPNLRISTFDVMGGYEFITCPEASFNYALDLDKLNPKLILVPSQFEHPLDAVHLYPEFDLNMGVLIHDLIPLTFREDLLPTKDQFNRFTERMLEIPKFSKVFSVSDFTAEDVRVKLGKDIQIHTIHGAGFSEVPNFPVLNFEKKCGILTIGAETPHKNIPRLVEAYAQLPESLRKQHELTIVGLNREADRKRMFEIASKFQVSVNIPSFLEDIELSKLYTHSRLVVVPSLAEGLSMPVMESWNFGTLALGGKDTVLEEVIGIKDLLFDPLSTREMSSLMIKFLENRDLWEANLAKSINRQDIFNWSNVVKKFVATL